MRFVLLRNHKINGTSPFCGKEKQILLALLCSSRQRIVLQQCFFSFRSFAASPSVTSTLYFSSMSDLTVDTVKAMPCQALRGEPSQRGLNPKGNLVKVFTAPFAGTTSPW